MDTRPEAEAGAGTHRQEPDIATHVEGITTANMPTNVPLEEKHVTLAEK